MKLIKTSIFSGIITLVRISTGFIAGKVVATITGPPGIALVGQFSNFITIILTFAGGSINTGVIKYTSEYESNHTSQKLLFSTSLKICIISSLSCGTILLLFSKSFSQWLFYSSQFTTVIQVFGISILFYAVNTLLLSILNGQKQIKLYTIANTLSSILGLILTVWLSYFYHITGTLYALVLAQSITCFLTILLIVKSKSPWATKQYFNLPFSKTIAKKLAQYSLMAIVSASTIPVSQMILRNILSSKIGITATGNWQGMMRISDGYLMLITTALGTYYLPKLASLQKDSELRSEIFSGYKIVLPVVFLGCTIIYLFRFFIINLLYTQSFSGMQALFAYQLLGDFFKIAALILAFIMLAKSMTLPYILTEIIFSTSYVFLGWVCISHFGEIGIAIAFAINYFIYLLVMIFLFKKLLFKI